ncbi:hypothetical protein ACWDWO_15010 [Actinopolymorpha singaporensis]
MVDDEVRAALDNISDLAPLHVPPALTLLDRLRHQLPDVLHVVCPDTAVPRRPPVVTAIYALPTRWRSRWDSAGTASMDSPTPGRADARRSCSGVTPV